MAKMNKLFTIHRKCNSAYQTVYKWYEEKRDECQRLTDNVDDLLLEVLTLEKNLEASKLTLKDTEKLRSNAVAAYDEQVAKNTALRRELEKVNDIVEKMSIEIDALQAQLAKRKSKPRETGAMPR